MIDETATAAWHRAVELRNRDLRARRLVDMVVAAAHQQHGRVDPHRAEQDAHDIATAACALLIEAIYRQDAELSAARLERDHYRKLAEEALLLSPARVLVVKDCTSAEHRP